MERNRLIIVLASFLLGLACESPIVAIAYGDATSPHINPKHMEVTQRSEFRRSLAIAAVIASTLTGGAAFGASFGALLGKVRLWPVLGAVVSIPAAYLMMVLANL
jgi:uncharacterized membrane protein YoaK (UPF0700 family)